MIEIKSINHTKESTNIVYEVSHTTGLLTTTLTQDFAVSIRKGLSEGSVSASMNIANLSANSVDEARLKMAEWLERMAVAMREPMETQVVVPLFKRTADFCLRPHEQIEFDRILGTIISEVEAEKEKNSLGEDDVYHHANDIIKEKIRELVDAKNPVVLIPGFSDQINILAFKKLGIT